MSKQATFFTNFRSRIFRNTLIRSSFLRNNSIFWFASLIVAFINYVYYPVLGRFMRPTDFGEVQAIVSIFTQMSIFFQVIGLINIGMISKYSDEEQRTERTDEISRLALYISVFLLLGVAIFAPELKGFFRFETMFPFFALACSLLISVPLAFSNSFLQGNKRFWTLATSNLILSVGRIVFAVLFVIIGLKTLGAIGGLLISQILALIYSLRKGKGIKQFIVNHLQIKKPDYSLIRGELPYVCMVFMTSLTTNLLLSLDILVVKHYFPPKEAGYYTGISIVANIVYFVTGPIAGVLISFISTTKPEKENLSYLKRSLLLLLPLGMTVTLLFSLVSHFVVMVLLGAKFAAYAQYLGGLTVALFMLSVSNLFIYYHIGLRHYFIAPTVTAGLIFSAILLQLRHGTMSFVVQDLEIGSLCILMSILILSMFYHFRRSGNVLTSNVMELS